MKTLLVGILLISAIMVINIVNSNGVDACEAKGHSSENCERWINR